MTTRFGPLFSVFLAVLLGITGVGFAALSFDPITWESGTGELYGWTSDLNTADAITSPVSGGNPGGYLQLYFDEPFPNLPETDSMYTEEADMIGDFEAVANVKFDYLGYPSSSQSLFFESDVGSGSTWVYDFNASATPGAWKSQWISFESSSGWSMFSGSGSFFDALSSVTKVGIMLQHDDSAQDFVFGLDDWEYGRVPEPGAIVMGLTALMGMAGIFFRGRKTAAQTR